MKKLILIALVVSGCATAQTTPKDKCTIVAATYSKVTIDGNVHYFWNKRCVLWDLKSGK